MAMASLSSTTIGKYPSHPFSFQVFRYLGKTTIKKKVTDSDRKAILNLFFPKSKNIFNALSNALLPKFYFIFDPTFSVKIN